MSAPDKDVRCFFMVKILQRAAKAARRPRAADPESIETPPRGEVPGSITDSRRGRRTQTLPLPKVPKIPGNQAVRLPSVAQRRGTRFQEYHESPLPHSVL